MQGDTTQYRELQKQLKKELNVARRKYKDKVESMLSTGSSRPAWEGIKSMMGMQHKKCNISLNGKPDLVLSDELNSFYNRFNACDFSDELSVFKNTVSSQNSVVVDRNTVCRLFQCVRERKSPGLDGTGGQVLKNCAVQLADIFSFIFSMSLQLHKVPSLWKNSIIVPVPKYASPKSLNDFRPVALTSLVMKSFYSCFIESILTFSFICWYGSLSLRNKNRLQGIVRVCSKIAGISLNDLTALYQLRTLSKVRSILGDQSHPLAGEFLLLPSGRRYILPKCRTNRLKHSFFPAAIALLNK